jgi:hypothetical protein
VRQPNSERNTVKHTNSHRDCDSYGVGYCDGNRNSHRGRFDTDAYPAGISDPNTDCGSADS